jgi:hypothetical protein
VTLSNGQTLNTGYVRGPQGTTGQIGAIGPQGLQGIQGPIGQTGAIGAIGPQGPAGTNGTNGISVTNSFVQNDSLYVVLSNGQTLNTGYVRGPQGAQGIQGIQGPIGQTGATGVTGAIGPQGIQGQQGPAGANGVDGVSITNSYVQGDSLYVVLSNGQTLNTGYVRGPQGATGPIGPQGIQGSTGPQGPTGANGSSGLQGSTGNGFVSNQSLSAMLNGGSVQIKKIKLDSNNNVILLGFLYNNVTFFDTTLNGGASGNAFIMKLSNSNNLVWIKNIGSFGTNSKADLSIDNQGKIFCAFGSKLNCYDSNSILLWSQSVNSVIGCELDANQNLVLYTAANISKYSNSGSLIWNQLLTSDGQDICVDLNGNPIIVYNWTCGSCGMTTVQKRSASNGTVLWASSTSGCGGGSCTGPPLYGTGVCPGKSIITDLNNDVYVIASCAGGNGLYSMQLGGVGGNYLKLASTNGSVSVAQGYGVAPISNVIRKEGTNEIYTLANQNNTSTLVYIVRINTLSQFLFNSNLSTYDIKTAFDKNNKFYIAYTIQNSELLAISSANQIVPTIPGNSGISIMVFNP